MDGYLAPGVRETPSALEAAIIRQSWYLAGQHADAGLGGPSFANPSGQFGFVELAAAVQTGLANPPVGVLNGDFSAVNGSGAPTSWNTLGNVVTVGGNAVLNSVAGRLYTDLSQTFLVPGSASRLEFTLTSALLQHPAGRPGDAFEMALLNAVTTAPLFGQAILNISNGTSVSSLFDSATLAPIYEALYPNAA